MRKESVQRREKGTISYQVTALLLTAGAVLVASIGCKGGISQEDHRQALIDTREAVVDAINEGDLERIFSFWTDDVAIYPVSESAVREIDAVREYVRRNRQELGLAPRMTPIEIVASESGDLGYVVGTYVWVDRDGKATLPGRYVTLWRKNDHGDVEVLPRDSLSPAGRGGLKGPYGLQV